MILWQTRSGDVGTGFAAWRVGTNGRTLPTPALTGTTTKSSTPSSHAKNWLVRLRDGASTLAIPVGMPRCVSSFHTRQPKGIGSLAWMRGDAEALAVSNTIQKAQRGTVCLFRWASRLSTTILPKPCRYVRATPAPPWPRIVIRGGGGRDVCVLRDGLSPVTELITGRVDDELAIHTFTVVRLMTTTNPDGYPNPNLAGGGEGFKLCGVG